MDKNSSSVVRVDAVLGDREEEYVYQLPINPSYHWALFNGPGNVWLGFRQGLFTIRDCAYTVNWTIPNGTLFKQVHLKTGYAYHNPNIQSPMPWPAWMRLRHSSPIGLIAITIWS
jgi:hypothetical protein